MTPKAGATKEINWTLIFYNATEQKPHLKKWVKDLIDISPKIYKWTTST